MRMLKLEVIASIWLTGPSTMLTRSSEDHFGFGSTSVGLNKFLFSQTGCSRSKSTFAWQGTHLQHVLAVRNLTGAVRNRVRHQMSSWWNYCVLHIKMGLPGPFENCPARSKVSFCLAGHTFAIAVRSLGPAAGVALAALVAQIKSRGHCFNDYPASVLTLPNTFFKQVVKNFESAVVQF